MKRKERNYQQVLFCNDLNIFNSFLLNRKNTKNRIELGMTKKMEKWNLILTIECESECIAKSVMKDAKLNLERLYRDIIITGKVMKATDLKDALKLFNENFLKNQNLNL